MEACEAKLGKSQSIRLIDVFVFTPTMLYASTYKEMPNWLRTLLFMFGITTLFYNANNYFEIGKECNKWT